MSHALTRTSPRGKGQPFIGTCIKCGLQNIPLSRMHEECVNPGNLSNADALAIVVRAPRIVQ
jgi:hypothetical protein